MGELVPCGISRPSRMFSKLLCSKRFPILPVIAEYEGAISNSRGLDVEAVMKHRKETGSILNFSGATNLPHRNDALELECDILIPAALGNQITEQNAPRVQARIIAEGAMDQLPPLPNRFWQRKISL